MPTAIEPSSSQPAAAAPQTTNKFVTELNPKGIKPCCACPETKMARDECFLKFGHSVEEDGESAKKCQDLVRRHRECMASLGFKI